jgi:hypothetical protein
MDLYEPLLFILFHFLGDGNRKNGFTSAGARPEACGWKVMATGPRPDWNRAQVHPAA